MDLLKYKINQAYKIASQSAADYVLKTVALLVENGADVNAKNSDGKPVIFSALVGTHSIDLEVLKFFISKGADVNIRDAQGNTPLFYAFGNQEAVDILLAPARTSLSITTAVCVMMNIPKEQSAAM